MQGAIIISPSLKTSFFCADSHFYLLSWTRKTNYWGRGDCDNNVIQAFLLQTFPSGHIFNSSIKH